MNTQIYINILLSHIRFINYFIIVDKLISMSDVSQFHINNHHISASMLNPY